MISAQKQSRNRKHFTDGSWRMAHGSFGLFRGFTLTELMIAVVVLIVVIIATSKIFGTASKVTAIGQANADVLQEAAAIQRLIQDDINRISREGFLGIHCVAVPNDINVLDGGPLLNPLRPADATIRADQLVFFRNGLAGLQSVRVGSFNHHKGQGTTAMVYYGHGFQLLDGLASNLDSPGTGNSPRRTHDPLGPIGALNEPITPWFRGDLQMVRTFFKVGGGTGTDVFSFINDGTIDGTQPESRQWLLCRQQVALLDDDQNTNPANNQKAVYLFHNPTARSVFYEDPGPPSFPSHEIRNGRLDGAASRLNDIHDRIFLGYNPSSMALSDFWINTARPRILDQIMLYPRAERTAPSMDRADQALTNHVLASACSSFRIEWTYAPRTGEQFDGNSSTYGGFNYGPGFGNGPGPAELEPVEQPWFGWFDSEHGVFPYRTPVDWNGSFPPQWNGQVYPWWRPAFTLGWDAPNNQFALDQFETYTDPFRHNPPVKEYAAIFGFNQDTPLIEDTNPASPTFGQQIPDLNLLYTPWPNALRITITLHDPQLNLDRGREIQFIVNLPQRSD